MSEEEEGGGFPPAEGAPGEVGAPESWTGAKGLYISLGCRDEKTKRGECVCGVCLEEEKKSLWRCDVYKTSKG